MNVGRLMIACLATSLGGALTISSAFAQTDTNTLLRNSAANELGVLQYCQSKGHIDGTAIDAQKTVVAHLPAGASTDAAETLGKQGTILGANGNNVAIATMASQGHTTEAALCTQMASSVKQATTANPAMSIPSMPGGMPSIPGGMPAMPNGVPAMPGGMPAVPGAMPAMPTTPSQQ